MEGIGVWVIVWVVCGLFGSAIGGNKKMGSGAGCLLGFLLGPLGLLFALLSSNKSTTDKIEARPTEAGWHPDPLGRFDSRYFDGRKWSQHVGRIEGDGTRRQFEDPV